MTDLARELRRDVRPLCLLALLALVVYAPEIGWGVPHATAANRIKTWATDEIVPLEALAEMHNTFVVSRPDRNYGYPWWDYFVVACAQAPFLAGEMALGGMKAPSPEYPYGFAHPAAALRDLTLIGRAVSVVMGAGIVVLTFLFADTLFGRFEAWASAFFVLFAYPMVFYARTGNLDVPALFWSAPALVAYAGILVRGLNTRRVLVLGAFAGLAAATKDQEVLVFLPLGLCLLPAVVRSDTPVRHVALGLGSLLAAYAVGTGMWIDPSRELTHVQRLLFAPKELSVSWFYLPPHPHTAAGLLALAGDTAARLRDAFTIPVLIAAAVGAVRAARRAPRLLVLWLPLPGIVLGLFVPTGVAMLRYLLPVTPIVDAFAAHGIAGLRGTRLRAWTIPVLLVCLAPRLLYAFDLTLAQWRDPRLAAGTWLGLHLHPGDRVGYFGPSGKLPAIPADVSTQLVGPGPWHGRRLSETAARAALSGAGAPDWIVVVPDWTTPRGGVHSGDLPPALFHALEAGEFGYDLAARFEERSPLPPALRRPALDSPMVAPPVRIFKRAAP